MKFSIMICLLFLAFIGPQVLAAESKKVVKIKKTKVNPKELKHIRATSSDEQFYYIEISAEELKLIEDGRRLFNESRKFPPPSENFQKKMQDQVGYPEDEK